MLTSMINMDILYRRAMRSLRYILTGRPHTVEDCLHFAREHPRAGVTLSLTTEVLLVGSEPLVEMVVEFVWHFEGGDVACRQVCAAFGVPVERATLRKRVAQANRAVRNTLRRVAAIAPVRHAGRRAFNYKELFDRTSSYGN